MSQSVSDFRRELLDKLSGLHAEFKVSKTNVAFSRKAKIDIGHEFRIVVVKQPDSFLLVPEVNLSSLGINKLFNEITGFDQPAKRTTEGFFIRNVYRDRGNYVTGSLDLGYDQTVELIRLDFLEIALPYFESNHCLEQLDRTMNIRGPNGKFAPPGLSVFSASNGLIVAKECLNPDFIEIYDDYLEFCQRSQGRKLSNPIELVRTFYESQFGNLGPLSTGSDS